MKGAVLPGKAGARAGTDFPPSAGAPRAVPPIAQSREQRAVAPYPLIDRYPIIIGSRLTERYVSSVFRMAQSGYRMQLVDLLDELLDNDPHLFSVVEKRVMATANGKIEIKPCDVPEDDKRDHKLAADVATMVQREVDRIPRMTQTVATLLWGIYYGISASEIFWTRDSEGWHVDRFDFIHSRRLAYPDQNSWTLHIWDQGQVLGWDTFGSEPTNTGVFGVRIADWPGKFIVFSPQLRGNYPTREGLGMLTATFTLFKRAGVRGAMDYLERYALGFVDGTWATSNDQDPGKPREAQPEDIAELKDSVTRVGIGALAGYAHPDSIKLEAKGYVGTGTAKVTYAEWIEICDSMQSKACLGGTLSTDHKGSGGLGGSGTAQVQERAEVDLEQFDATCFAEAFREAVVFWLVKMNMPEALRLVPNVFINVDREPDAKTVLENSLGMTKIGGRVDLDKVSDTTGVPLIPQEEEPDGEVKPRGSFLSDVVDPTMVHDDLMSNAAKQQKQDQVDAQHELAKAKASAPTTVAGQPLPTAGAAGGAGATGTPGGPEGKGKNAKAGGGKPGKGPAANGKSSKSTRMRLTSDEFAQYTTVCTLLSQREDGGVARAVYEQLLEDYPAWALGWVLSGTWVGPVDVPLEDVDFSHRDEWRATHDGTLPSYVEKIKAGAKKPAVYVKTPTNPKTLPVDGHHRTLAYESMGQPVPAYVLTTQTEHGPWLELHAMQTKGSSKGGSRQSSYTSRFPDDTSSFIPRGAPSLIAHPVTMDVKPNVDLRPAAIVVAFDEAGQILTVSRPEPPHEQAFPGGMHDDGETIEETAAREFTEETGAEIEREDDGTPVLEPLIVTSSPTDGRPLHVFRAPRWSGDPYAAEPATVVRFMPPSDFFAQSVLFRDVIRELMARGLLSPSASGQSAEAAQ